MAIDANGNVVEDSPNPGGSDPTVTHTTEGTSYASAPVAAAPPPPGYRVEAPDINQVDLSDTTKQSREQQDIANAALDGATNAGIDRQTAAMAQLNSIQQKHSDNVYEQARGRDEGRQALTNEASRRDAAEKERAAIDQIHGQVFSGIDGITAGISSIFYGAAGKPELGVDMIKNAMAQDIRRQELQLRRAGAAADENTNALGFLLGQTKDKETASLMLEDKMYSDAIQMIESSSAMNAGPEMKMKANADIARLKENQLMLRKGLELKNTETVSKGEYAREVNSSRNGVLGQQPQQAQSQSMGAKTAPVINASGAVNQQSPVKQGDGKSEYEVNMGAGFAPVRQSLTPEQAAKLGKAAKPVGTDEVSVKAGNKPASVQTDIAKLPAEVQDQMGLHKKQGPDGKDVWVRDPKKQIKEAPEGTAAVSINAGHHFLIPKANEPVVAQLLGDINNAHSTVNRLKENAVELKRLYKANDGNALTFQTMVAAADAGAKLPENAGPSTKSAWEASRLKKEYGTLNSTLANAYARSNDEKTGVKKEEYQEAATHFPNLDRHGTGLMGGGVFDQAINQLDSYNKTLNQHRVNMIQSKQGRPAERYTVTDGNGGGRITVYGPKGGETAKGVYLNPADKSGPSGR